MGLSNANGSVWLIFAQKLQAFLQAQNLHASQCVVLLPYAQLIAKAKLAWHTLVPQGFSPRFASTQTWVHSLPKVQLGAHDWRGITAFDLPSAQFWLQQAKLPWQDLAVQKTLTGMANALAPLAQGQIPRQRMVWREHVLNALSAWDNSNPWLAQEAALTQLALLWVAQSSYASDVLYSQKPGALVVLQGLQEDALCKQLLAQYSCPSLLLHWRDFYPSAICCQADGEDETATNLADKRQASAATADKSLFPQAQCAVYRAKDIQEEALATCAALLRALDKDAAPVALVAQDRLLTRRVSALLLGQGIAVQDQTGWPLSTTHAAATLIAPLLAASAQAGWAEVLQWLHQSPAFADTDFVALERYLEQYPEAVQVPAPIKAIPEAVWHLRASLSKPRSLPLWLQDLRQVLQAAGQWQPLVLDAAGASCIRALCLDAPERLQHFADEHWSLVVFTHWVQQVLESGRFRPQSSAPKAAAQVCILPLEQLLGRGFAHIVFPGCDANNLPRMQTAPPWWGQRQRLCLGFDDLQTTLQARALAWEQVLHANQVDFLYRSVQADEVLQPSPYLQDWLLAHPTARIQDAHTLLQKQMVHADLLTAPTPSAKDALPAHLSASSYQWLRDCPYRFFAHGILQLRDAFDPDAAPDARAYGAWLHAVLRRFHEHTEKPGAETNTADTNQESHTSLTDTVWDAHWQTAAQTLDAIAQDELQRRGLRAAAFLPWRTLWPRLRTGYLHWLRQHQGQGWRFAAGELSLECVVSVAESQAAQSHPKSIRLKGTIDRVDQSGSMLAVIDYKSEYHQTTKKRVAAAAEDVQLAFYTALLQETTAATAAATSATPAAVSDTDTALSPVSDSVAMAFYLGLDAGNKDAPTGVIKAYPLLDPVLAANTLLAGIASDMGRIAQGAALQALGDGPVCQHCKVRGLCQRDYWK